MDKYDFFVPSVWYKDNKYVSAKALASNYQDNDYYLPWQAFNLLEPLVMFQDVFGKLDLDEIGKMPLSRRNGLHHAYSARRGFEKSF